METRFGTAIVRQYPARVCLSERGADKGTALRDAKRTVEVRATCDESNKLAFSPARQTTACPPTCLLRLEFVLRNGAARCGAIRFGGTHHIMKMSRGKFPVI